MINLLDPSALPKSTADGPVTWGEAVMDLAGARDAADTIIETSMSDRDLLETIYNQRIDRIEALTGERLENPIQSRAFGVVPVPGFLQPPFREAYQEQERAFDQRLQAMAEKYPQLSTAFSETVEAEKTRLMREAEERAKEASASPALGPGGRLAGELLGGLRAAARDPLQWQMAITSGGGSTAKTVAGRIGQTVLTEAMLNGGQELVLQGLSQERKAAAGLDHGMADMLANAGIAATFGALFGGTLQGGAELARIFKLGEGGAERAARVLEGRPEPGDVETLAKAMNVELGPERLDMINRSFEERVLDEVTVRPDATPGELRVLEAAQRYADDPDNNPPPELIERLVADEEAARMRFSPDEYERMFAGDPNAIDDIGDTFFADTVDDAARRIDRVEARVQQLSDDIRDQTIRPPKPTEPLDDPAMEEAERLAGDLIEPRVDKNGNPENWLEFVPFEDGAGNNKRPVSVFEALEIAEEPNRLADVLESCRL